FQPEKYKVEVRERQLELIHRKIEGEHITAAPAEAPQTQIIDLMAALKASLARSDDADAAGGRKPAQRAAAKTAARKTTKRKASGG
ncbi:MAG: Ku protein, partial [Longimicrobiales bacterium]